MTKLARASVSGAVAFAAAQVVDIRARAARRVRRRFSD